MKIIWIVSLAYACFHLYTAFFGSLEALYQRSFHFMLAGFLVFAINPLKIKKGKKLAVLVDILLMVCAVIPVLYLAFNHEMIITRFYYIAPLKWYEYLFCAMLVVAILEGTRRKMGLALPIIALSAIAYMMFGQYLPGELGHSGFTTVQLVDTLYTTTEGIFGLALGASATFVILFIIFGAFLKRSEMGEYLIDFAMALTRKSTGGPAKSSVIASCMFGSISGSTLANVVTTGQITIPLMKKTGYSSSFAGAVEAVASTGGQIMPPVMGTAVFIMSEFTGIPYSKILLGALLPALLYYFAVYIMVHLEAVKIGIKNIVDSKAFSLRNMLKRSYLFLPIVILIIILMMGYSPQRSVLFSMGSVILISMVDWKNRLRLLDILNCLVSGAKGITIVAMACSCAGIMVGIINYTGLGIKLSSALVNLSQGNMVLALVMTAVVALILGMGLPTTPAYIIVASLLVPAIVRMGVPLFAAHLFAFYFANISAITPPVALAAYAAAAIADCSPMNTGFQAFRLGIASYIIPFMFVFNPILLLIGNNPLDIILAIAFSALGIFFLAISAEGYFVKVMPVYQRAILLVSAVLLIKPGIATDLFGLTVGLLLLLPMYLKNKKEMYQAQV